MADLPAFAHSVSANKRAFSTPMSGIPARTTTVAPDEAVIAGAHPEAKITDETSRTADLMLKLTFSKSFLLDHSQKLFEACIFTSQLGHVYSGVGVRRFL